MDDRRFWMIVDRTALFEADPERQIEALREQLDALSADEIVAFRNAFEAQLARAYTWDLWAVLYIAHGGATDDGFEYFRRWLVSKGSATFEALLGDPDGLADRLAGDGDGILDFEQFLYVTNEVWSEKTGQPASEMPLDMTLLTMGEDPRGEPFPEDPEELERRFPKTWKKFGNRPLL